MQWQSGRTGRLCALALACAVTASGAGPAADTAQPAEIMPRAARSILLDLARSGGHYYAVGDRGHILRSGDGREWQQLPAPVRAMLNRIRFTDADNGWIVGHDASLLHSRDGGQSWQLVNYDPEDGRALHDLLFLDERRGFVCGAGGLLWRTDNGGETWQTVAADFLDLGLHLFSLTRLGDGTLLITGEKGLLARSTDQGASWRMLASPYIGSYFGALPQGEAGALLYGLRGNVWVAGSVRSLPLQEVAAWDEFSQQTLTDPAQLARLGWRHLDNPAGLSLFGGTRLADGRALLVGVNGSILLADAEARRLTAVPNPYGEIPLSAVLPADGGLLLTGRNGLLELPLERLP